MHLTGPQTLAIILAVAAGTQVTRWLSFLLFPENRTPPAWVTDMGKLLPPAMMGLLVVYCLRNVDLTAGGHGLPELIAIALTVALHLWKRQMLLSIAGGTVCYMLLMQMVF